MVTVKYTNMRREDKRRVRAAMLVECRNILRRTWVLASPAKGECSRPQDGRYGDCEGEARVVLVAFLLAFWPFHHKPKPKPNVADAIVSASELADDLAELANIHDNYPWLRSWAEPSLDVVNRLLDAPNADDMDQLRHDIKVLKAMEDNATI